METRIKNTAVHTDYSNASGSVMNNEFRVEGELKGWTNTGNTGRAD